MRGGVTSGRAGLTNLLLCLLAAGLWLSGKEIGGTEQERLVPVRGATHIANVLHPSFGLEASNNEIQAAPGDVLLVRLKNCDCPGKEALWLYFYTSQDAEPIAFAGNEWCLRLGRAIGDKVVALIDVQISNASPEAAETCNSADLTCATASLLAVPHGWTSQPWHNGTQGCS